MRIICCLIIVALPGTAWAHAPMPGIDGFYWGLLHPFTIPGALLALLAFGLLLGQHGEAAFRKGWLGFAIAMAIGVAVTMSAGETVEPNTPLMVFAFLAGLYVASALPLPNAATFLVGLPIGYLIGIASVPDPGPLRATIITLAGTILGAHLFLLYVAGAVVYLRRKFDRPWLAIGLRVLGSWLAAIAALMIALSFAQQRPVQTSSDMPVRPDSARNVRFGS